jgi:hypothetical protein
MNVGPLRASTPAVVQCQLELFVARCRQLADRVRLGHIGFIEAVDTAYSAALWSGLADNVTDDRLQACLAYAFMGVRPPTLSRSADEKRHGGGTRDSAP